MDKVVDFSKSVFELSRNDQEIVDIMKELGFEGITNAAMLNTAGRYMTIPKGAAMKGINMDKIKEVFNNKGYRIIE